MTLSSSNKVYLDYAATTPVDDRVLEAMLPYFSEIYGNPSSVHTYGQQGEAALEISREKVAESLNCRPDEVIFTSGGSESDNLALRGVAFAARQQRNANHILISPVEHHAVLRTAQQLASLHGFTLEYLPVDEFGRVQAEDVARHIRSDTALVSVIFANNEIGTINPVSEIGAKCRELGVPFHTDAVQAAAYLSINLEELNVDLLSIGAHKFYGPKGVGILCVKQGIPLIPTQTGGSQESNRRAGTHNIPYIVGLAKALWLAQTENIENSGWLTSLRDHMIGQVLEEIPNSQLTGHPSQRLPNHASFVFDGVDGNLLLTLLDVAGFACSSGSACKTGDPEPSEVLLALGLSRSWALGSLRITMGKNTTPPQVEAFLGNLPRLVKEARWNNNA